MGQLTLMGVGPGATTAPVVPVQPTDVPNLKFWYKSDTEVLNQSGVDFDGVGYLQQTDPESTSMSGSYYCAFFIKISTFVGGWITIIDKSPQDGDSAGINCSFRLEVSQDEQKLRYHRGNWSGGAWDLELNTTISLDTSYFIEFWYTISDGAMHIRKDMTDTNSGFSDVSSNIAGYVTLGAQASGARPFTGTVDQIGFWLSDISVTYASTLYNFGNGRSAHVLSSIPGLTSNMQWFFDLGEQSTYNRVSYFTNPFSAFSSDLVEVGTHLHPITAITECPIQDNIGENYVVSRWGDQSGNVLDVINIDANLQPIYNYSLLNGYGAVTFETSKYLYLEFTLINPITVFIVTKLTTTGSYRSAFGALEFYESGGTEYISGDSGVTNLAASLPAGFAIQRHYFHNATGEIQINNSATVSGPINSSAGDVFGIYIGDGNQELVEMFAYEGSPTANQIAGLFLYLNNKYAIY